MGGAGKKVDKSLQGKKPVNTAKHAAKTYGTQRNPSHIGNKLKRSEMYGKYLQQKRSQKRDERLKRAKEGEALGDAAAAPRRDPKTIDSTRETEPTVVDPNDVEIQQDERADEFAPYLSSEVAPKVLITTRPRPSQNLFYFIADLQKLIPSLHFYPRKSYSVKEICQFARNRDFTHLIVLSEKSKQCNGMTVSHLRGSDTSGGPTAFFKVSSVTTSKSIPFHGASTHHVPELNLHGFGTRLGHRVGRMMASLFPVAEFRGRQVVTFHNQRDYIFVRQHRYIFKEKPATEEGAKKKKKEVQLDTTTAGTVPSPAAQAMNVKTRLQELGPRFTLKLRWLQEGTFDTQTGEYEFYHKRKEMDTSRRKFHL
jgi:ribosome production factor 1